MNDPLPADTPQPPAPSNVEGPAPEAPKPEPPKPESAAPSAPTPAPAPEGTPPPAPATKPDEADGLKGLVIEALRTVFDPEIPVNIYELGLIYEVDVDEDLGKVHIRMTLTSPACPVAGTLPGDVELKVKEVEGVDDCEVELVWEPPWSMELLSEEAKLQLGLL